MKFLDSVSNYISQTLFEAGSISKEDIPVYNYCLSYFLENLIYCTYILILSLITGQFLNGLLVILVFMPLKICAGGYHAKTPRQCFFFSYGIILAILLPVHYLHITFTTSWIILYTICSILIVCLAPIDTPNKRITGNKRKVLKKYSFLCMLFLTALGLILLWIKCYQNYVVLVICICIIHGNQWIGLLANQNTKKGEN